MQKPHKVPKCMYIAGWDLSSPTGCGSSQLSPSSPVVPFCFPVFPSLSLVFPSFSNPPPHSPTISFSAHLWIAGRDTHTLIIFDFLSSSLWFTNNFFYEIYILFIIFWEINVPKNQIIYLCLCPFRHPGAWCYRASLPIPSSKADIE